MGADSVLKKLGGSSLPIYIETTNTVYEYYNNQQHHKIYINETYKTYDKLLLIALSGSVGYANQVVVNDGTIEEQKLFSNTFTYWDNGTLRQQATYVYYIILSDLSNMEYIDLIYGGTGSYNFNIFGIK